MRRRRFATGHWANLARTLPRQRRVKKTKNLPAGVFCFSLWLGQIKQALIIYKEGI